MSSGQEIDRDFSEVERWSTKLRTALLTWAGLLETTLEDWSATVELAGAAEAAVAAHVAEADPHPDYLTQAEADALYADVAHTHAGDYEPAGTAAAAVAAHEAAADPHPTYLTQSEADALYLAAADLGRINTLNLMSGGI